MMLLISDLGVNRNTNTLTVYAKGTGEPAIGLALVHMMVGLMKQYIDELNLSGIDYPEGDDMIQAVINCISETETKAFIFKLDKSDGSIEFQVATIKPSDTGGIATDSAGEKK